MFGLFLLHIFRISIFMLILFTKFKFSRTAGLKVKRNNKVSENLTILQYFPWSIWNHYEKNRQSSVVLFLLQINLCVSNIHACLLHVVRTQLICVRLMFFQKYGKWCNITSQTHHTVIDFDLQEIEQQIFRAIKVNF